MAYKVFLSHSHKDTAFSKNLASSLALNKYTRVYRADDKLEAGNKITTKVLEEIKRSDLAIVIWTKNSSASNWVNVEIGMAIAAKVPLLPLLLDKRVKLPAFFADVKAVTGLGVSGVMNQSKRIVERRARKKQASEISLGKKRSRISQNYDESNDPGYEDYQDALRESREAEEHEDYLD